MIRPVTTEQVGRGRFRRSLRPHLTMTDDSNRSMPTVPSLEQHAAATQNLSGSLSTFFLSPSLALSVAGEQSTAAQSGPEGDIWIPVEGIFATP
ncbi:hypothetical protein R1flu_016956 [Riccia fluitans]|uniref:Uncharacterized protein n=1 Tax=Riccia fluitans TaxID=41844 RepID=A0ABD1YNE8_9MARC